MKFTITILLAFAFGTVALESKQHDKPVKIKAKKADWIQTWEAKQSPTPTITVSPTSTPTPVAP